MERQTVDVYKLAVLMVLLAALITVFGVIFVNMNIYRDSYNTRYQTAINERSESVWRDISNKREANGAILFRSLSSSASALSELTLNITTEEYNTLPYEMQVAFGYDSSISMYKLSFGTKEDRVDKVAICEKYFMMCAEISFIVDVTIESTGLYKAVFTSKGR